MTLSICYFVGSSVQMKLYADNLKVFLEITSNFDNVIWQSCLNKIVQWSEVWQLKPATEKCQTY